MDHRKCGMFTPCHKPGCVDCAKRRVEHVLSLALAKSDPKWREPGGGPAEIVAYREWLEATVADLVATAFDGGTFAPKPAGPPSDAAEQIAAMLRETGAVDVHDDTMPLFDPSKQNDPLDVLSGVDKWVPVDVVARHIDEGVRQWWMPAS